MIGKGISVDTRWLEDFLSLAETGNFSRSARDRNVTQPAFSRRIRMLEHWAGGQLIDRSTYPTKLTPAGELFRDGVTPLLRDMYRLRDEVRGQAADAAATVVIAAMHSLSLSVLPKWLNAVAADDRALVRIRTDNHHDCLQALAEGSCDFFLSYVHPDHPLLLEESRYPHLDLGATALVPLSAPATGGKPHHKLPGTKRAPLSYLAFGADCYLGQVAAGALAKAKQPLHLDPCFEDTVADALQALAVAGHGVAWLPETSAANEMAAKRLVRAGGEAWDVHLEIRLYRARTRRSEAAERLWSNAVAYAKGLAAGPP